MSDDPFLTGVRETRDRLRETSKNCVSLTEEMKYEYAACIVDGIISRYLKEYPYD